MSTCSPSRAARRPSDELSSIPAGIETVRAIAKTPVADCVSVPVVTASVAACPDKSVISMVPALGPFGVNWISDRLNADKHRRMLGDAQKAARAKLRLDTWLEAKAAF